MSHWYTEAKQQFASHSQPYWPLYVAKELGVPISWPAQYLRAAPDGTLAREGVSLPDFKRCIADHHGIPE
jgi:hypothetical protein